MGWIGGADGHGGWVANVLADGRVSASSVSEGVIVREVFPGDVAAGWEVRRYPGSADVEVVVPWDQVVSWRVSCVCGWAGGELPAVTEAKYGTRECPGQLEDEVFFPQWQAHVAPLVALLELERLVGQLHEVEAHIDVAVRAARGGGASWAQVGRAAGLSKQGAQQRWG